MKTRLSLRYSKISHLKISTLRGPHVAVALSVLAAVGATLACKKRSFNTSSTKSFSPSLTTLDANDVSILFPMPQDPSRLGDLLSLSTLNAAGKPLVSPKLFASILEKTDYTKLADPSKRKNLKSGIILDGKRPRARLSSGEGAMKEEGPFSFGDYAKWHIVAMRFDPCATTRVHNRRSHRDQPLPRTYDGGACEAQLRLTAQPLIRRDEDRPVVAQVLTDANGEPLLNPDGSLQFQSMPMNVARPKAMQAGDFAMHLIFPLTPDKAKEFAQGLLAFKAACKALGDGLPLSVNPCLLAEKRGALGANKPSQVLRDLVLKHANNMTLTAFMGTLLGIEPWMFYTGQVQGEEFVHVPLNLVRIGDEEPVALGRAGKPLPRPFDDGMFQMLTFTMAGSTTDNANILQNKSPMVPQARKSKVNDDLNEALRDEVIFNPSSFGNEQSSKNLKALEVAGRILNPAKNDPLSTDCVSCHVATRILKDTAGTLSFLSDDKPALAGFRKSEAAATLQSKYLHLGDGRVTSLPSLREFNNERYNVMQFGYFLTTPTASFRTALESAEAANFANTILLNATAPRPIACEPQKILDCHISDIRPTNEDANPDFWTFPTQACLAKACPDVLKANKDVYPEPVALEATQDTRVYLWPEEPNPDPSSSGCRVAKGTRFLAVSEPHRNFQAFTMNPSASFPDLSGVTIISSPPECDTIAFNPLYFKTGHFKVVNDPGLLFAQNTLPPELKKFETCKAVFTTGAAPIMMGGSSPGTPAFMLAANTLLRVTGVAGGSLKVESGDHGIPAGSLMQAQDAVCSTDFGVTEKVTLTDGANIRWAPATDKALVGTVNSEQARVLQIDSTRSWFLIVTDSNMKGWTHSVNIKK